MARIGIDAPAIAPAGTGHARTQRHAVEALAAAVDRELVVFVRSEEAAELLAPAGVRCEVVRMRPSIAWEQVGLPLAARRLRLDAVLTWSERTALAGGPPTVIWLFESPLHRIRLNRETGVGAYQRTADLLTEALWRRSLRRAVHVAFGSEATRREVLAELPELEGRSSVVYPGLAPGFSPGPSTRSGRYVLHLGSADARDDSETAIEAFRLARLDGVGLVVAGGLGQGEAALRRAAAGLDAEFTGRVPDAELADLYRGAAAFIDTSLFEGFGYAVLEAMACGVPIVASGAPSLPEVLGDAGILCVPGSAPAFADALRRVLEESALADELRERAVRRAGAFTWAQAGEGLLAALSAL
jgi:glycosyltransferase involved in cell wall biosynthesis